jgi:serine/threonine protein kinase
MSGMNGTCHYMAPEIFGKDSVYDNKIDIWAVGIVLFALLCGCFPFDDKFMSRVEDKIQEGKYEFPQEIDEAISNDAKKFVAYLLQVNPKDRPSAKVVLQHPWLQPNGASAIPFSSQHMHKIRDFAALRLQVHGKYVPPPSTIP